MPNNDNLDSSFDISAKEKMINRRINKVQKKYNVQKEELERILKEDTSKMPLVSKEYIKLRKRYNRAMYKADSLAIDIKYGIDNIDLEKKERELMKKAKDLDVSIPKSNKIISELDANIPKVNKKVKRKNKYRKFLPVVEAAALIVAGSLSIIVNNIAREDLVNQTIETYSEELDSVVKDAIHEKYNFDSDKVLVYINYDEIANYIKHCKDPDIALFTLYRNYGRKDNSIYEGITNNTCKELDFDNDDIKSFIDYIDANGYHSYREYYKDSKQAIINDYFGGEEGLENIKVKVKKLK